MPEPSFYRFRRVNKRYKPVWFIAIEYGDHDLAWREMEDRNARKVVASQLSLRLPSIAVSDHPSQVGATRGCPNLSHRLWRSSSNRQVLFSKWVAVWLNTNCTNTDNLDMHLWVCVRVCTRVHTCVCACSKLVKDNYFSVRCWVRHLIGITICHPTLVKEKLGVKYVTRQTIAYFSTLANDCGSVNCVREKKSEHI